MSETCSQGGRTELIFLEALLKSLSVENPVHIQHSYTYMGMHLCIMHIYLYLHILHREYLRRRLRCRAQATCPALCVGIDGHLFSHSGLNHVLAMLELTGKLQQAEESLFWSVCLC